jgi:hypothetical protein
MNLFQREIDLPQNTGEGSFIKSLERHIRTSIGDGELPIRFAITKTAYKKHKCELGVLMNRAHAKAPCDDVNIFKFSPRKHENTDKFNAVLLVPTGIGAELGGHSGDAGPLARFVASSCDQLITHPNVVNAADINELPENGLDVEGSVITSFIMGTTGLQRTRSNRVMLVMDFCDDRQISELTINTASAARATMGIDIPLVIELDKTVKMESKYSSSGCAVGRVEALENMYELLARHSGQYDAVAIHSGIDVPQEFHLEYLKSGGEMVNPWGGVEAMLTHSLTIMFDVPIAHAPMVKSMDIVNLNGGVVDPRIAAEAISSTFLLSVLKGLHKSPRIIRDSRVFSYPGVLTNADISCIIIPDGCIGLPTLAAMEQGIPVIAVRENKNRMQNNLKDFPFLPGKLFIVENYLEAVGVMNALKAGVAVPSIRRPLTETNYIYSGENAPELEEEQGTKRNKVVKLIRE